MDIEGAMKEVQRLRLVLKEIASLPDEHLEESRLLARDALDGTKEAFYHRIERAGKETSAWLRQQTQRGA